MLVWDSFRFLNLYTKTLNRRSKTPEPLLGMLLLLLLPLMAKGSGCKARSQLGLAAVLPGRLAARLPPVLSLARGNAKVATANGGTFVHEAVTA